MKLKTFKRFVGMFLAFVMAVSVLPVRLVAEESTVVSAASDSRTIVLQQGHVPLIDAELVRDDFYNIIGVPNNPLFAGTPLGSTPYSGTIDVGSIMRRDGAPASNNGFLFANPLEPVLASRASDAVWLMYFDLVGMIPELETPGYTIEIEDVTLYLHMNNAPNNVSLSVHRVVDTNNMASYLAESGPGWVPGTHGAGGPAPNTTTMNNGVSWFFRDNGFADPTLVANTGAGRDAVPDRQRVGWTALNDSLPVVQNSLPTLRDSVIDTPSASLAGIAQPLNRWLAVSGNGMAADVQAWIENPAENQGWMFEFIGPAFNARSSRHNDLFQRPVLAITYSVSEGPPATSIILDTPVAQESGFDLTWATDLHDGDVINRYVASWTDGTISGTAETTTSSLNLRDYRFDYGVDFTITVSGYNGTTLIATSINSRVAAIVDARNTIALVDGFTHTWSQVYTSANYRVEFGTMSNPASWTQYQYSNTATATITGLAQGTWYYRVVALGASNNVLRTGAVRSTVVEGASVTLTAITPGEDRFTLAWTAQGMDSFSVTYTLAGGSPVTVENAVSPFTVGSVAFDYGVAVEFVVRGYYNNVYVGSSSALTSQIVDRRAVRAFSDGFMYTWSNVYGAQLFVINYWMTTGEVRTTTTTSPMITIRDSAVFTPGQVWYFEVIAYSTPTADASAVLRTLSGMSVTIPEPSGPIDLEPQTITLRQGVDGYTGALNVGTMIPNHGNLMGSSRANALHLGLPDGRILLYFDLEGIFPPGIDPSNVFVTDVMISMFQSFNVNLPRDVQVHRVLDPDNLGMWNEGTNNAGLEWNISARNDGASWFFRDNGFDLPGAAGQLVRPQTPWTLSGNGSIDTSLAPTPSSIRTITNHTPFANNRADFTGGQLAQDVNAWISDPAANQGWMFSRILVDGINDTAGPHFWGIVAPNLAHRPMLTLTFLDLTDIGDDAIIFQNEVVPDEDGFYLQWFPFGDMNRFVVEFNIDGIPHSFETTETTAWVRSAGFVYDEDFTFTIIGYYNNVRITSSEPKTGQIVDNREFETNETGFDLSWSRVYGAVEYVIEVVRQSDNQSYTVTVTSTSVNINNPALFTFGYFTYRLTARDASGNILRDSGIISFGRPDVTPPVTTFSVQGGATWAYSPTDALLLPVNRGPVTISIDSATDKESGVARTEFRFNNDHHNTFQENNPGIATNSWNHDWVLDPWREISVGGSIVVPYQGVTRVWIRSVDYAGNVECPTPIYIVIDNSPLFIEAPVVRSGGVAVDSLQPGAGIDVSMTLTNRDPQGGDFTAYLMAVLFDASGSMRNLVVSPSTHFAQGTTATLTTASMALPSRVDGWYLEILLLDDANDNPFYNPIRFPNYFNTHRHTLPRRPMVNSITVSAMPPIITQQPRGLMIVNSAILPGETFALTVEAESIDNGDLSFQWFKSVNGGPYELVPVATDASFDVLVDELGGNGVYSFYVVVTNSRPGVTGQGSATAQSNTVEITITDEILLSDIGPRTVVADTLAADIDIMLGDHADAELFAFDQDWFLDQHNVWRDHTGWALADEDAEEEITILRYIMHPRYFAPAQLAFELAAQASVMPIDASNYTAYFTMRALHGEVSVASIITDSSVGYFILETIDMTLNEVDLADRAEISIFPGDRTALTPINEPAALAYALVGDRAMLYLYGEGGNRIDSFEVVLAMGPVIVDEIILYTYQNTSEGSITLYTMTGTRDDLTPTVIPADTIMRVRYSDGTWIDGEMAMQYGNLVRHATEHSRWILSGLEVGTGYSSLSGSAQGYVVYFIPYIPEAYFTVTVEIYLANSGSVTGLAVDGLYRRGETAELTAVAADWFRFVGWYDEENDLISNNPNLTFQVNYDIIITARFEDDDGIRTLFLQNGRPWQQFNDTPYTGNMTRNGIFDGVLGGQGGITGSGNPLSDLFIWNRDPDGANFATWVQQSLVHFDLDGYLPQGVEFVIESATLWLGHTRTGPQGGVADLHVYVLDDPNETGMWELVGSSWQYKRQFMPWYAGGSIDDVRTLSYVIADVNMENDIPNWLTADVTADVTAWINDGVPNIGWLLRQENAVASTTPGLANNPGAIVISNAANTAGWAPMLEIEFRIVYEVEAETLLTLTAPTDVILSQAVANYEAVIALLPDMVNVTTTGETTSLPINWSFTGTFDAAPGAQNTFAWAAQLGGILVNGVAAYGTIVVTNYTPTQLPVFSWNIFNNGPGGTQYPRPNAGLAASGTIRMWTQLDGVGAPVYLAAADTIVALDQNGENAMEFVSVSRVWVAGQGWANYFNVVDVNKNGDWQYINLYITVYGRVVHVLLANALFEVPAEDVTVTFVVEAGAVGVYAATTTTVVVSAGEAIPAATIPNTDARTGFYFAGWYPSDPAELAYVTEDITFTARFNPLFHNVTFVAGDGGVLVPTNFGLVVSIRDGFAFWTDRVPAPVANYGYEFVGWYPYNPAGFIVRENMTFTAVFAEAIPLEPQIVSVSPAIARVEQGGTVELVVTTQGMPDGAWAELHVAWHPGLSVVGGPRFYIVNNQATITIAAAANAQLGRNGFAVSARTAGDWGSVVMIDSYMFVIAVE